ncbi:HMCN1 [Branchiostoma lanceolatum]|uniref:HMCN1 protein n=1 Tax=Branchiostoma lanceolatum TaxID=7740 RepID=A0A8J9Z9K4_BRALA|nr:HMCN1 [Branchiostoma lanceolatum]
MRTFYFILFFVLKDDVDAGLEEPLDDLGLEDEEEMLINGDLASPKEPDEIPVKPKFMDKFKGTLVVEEGGTLTLTFKVVGVPTPKITWMQGDKILKPSSRIKMTTSDGDVTIVVKAVTMDEAGIYTCVAENSEGEAFCSATIKVKAKPKAESPKIILRKTRVTAGEGDTVRLEAIVKGEEVKVQWTQDGTLLRDSQETRYERKGETFALVIPLVEKEDSGKYTVEASNEGGKDEATVLLVVKDMSMPARILKKPESTSVLEGEAAAFTCEVEGSPPPTVSWAKDGRLLHDDGRVSLRTEGKTHTLEITKTLISHSADYVCMASNKHGEDNCDFSLTVEELPVPPVFKKTPKDETVEEGKWVKFVCEVDGAPAPEAQWFRGDHLITTTGLCRVRTSSFTPLLEIYSVRVEDAGNYKCIVKNDGGEISCHFKLGVTAKPTSPRITRKPASETVKEEQKVTFTSKVTGYPRPEVTWSKDGRTIQEDERHIIAVDGQTYTLEILSAVFSDEGNWACVARNKRGQDKCIFTLTVQEKPFPPEFVIKPKSTTVEEGTEAVFDVQVDGEPQPKVTWVKDDEEIVHTRKHQIIDDGDRHSLVIPSAAVSDAGNYICKVTNSEGEVSCDFNFNVNRKPCPPEFLTKPRSGIIDEGTNHSFECELGGEPLPVVTWHKEGKQLSQDDRIRIRTEENKAFLSLLPTEMADSGKWSIIAKNVRGQKKYEFTLSIREVPVPPEFVKSPESITIDEGEAAEFACEITGKPAPMVNWYKDSTQVKQDARHTVSADGTVYSLDIKPALITDKGNYKVVARGANEQQTSEFKLTVREKFSPPTFPNAPKDITADVGKPIKVTVEIKGEPKPSVKWTKKDKKIKVLEGGDGYSITSSGNKYTLEIPCADFKDSAEYTIEASNIRGSVSKSFKMNVVEVKVPPEFLSKPEDQTVMEGQSVEFSCEVEGDPEPQVIWSKDSRPLHEGGQFSITTVDFSSTLEIDNVTLDNKGTYTCTIRNKHSEKKCTVTLNVDERPFAPEFLEPPASQTVEEGKSAKFTCEVDGEPAPKVSWEKDGQTLKKGKRYKISGDDFSSTLEIPTVLSTDGGSYACVLENAEGTITEEFTLTVQEGEQHKEITQDQLQSLLSSIDSGSTEDTDMFYSIDEASPPEFKSELNDIVCKEDEEVVFSCTVHGAPDPEISWYKDGKSIKPSKYFQMSYDGETAELTLDGAFPEDSGVYTCTARNPAGDVSKSAKLTVEELESPLKRSMSEEEDVTAGPSPPKFSQALQDEVCERNSIAQLTCKVSGNPKPRVTWMKGDTVLTEGDRYEIFEEKGSFNMEIYDTLPSDSGTYTCVASNAHGTVKCSAELLIADGDELEAAEEDREGMFARKPLPHEDEEEEEEISSEGTVNTVTESHAFSEDQEVRSARVPSIPAPVRRVPPPESTPDDASPVGSRAPHGTGVAAKGVVSADDDEPVLHVGGLAKPTKPAKKPKWPRAQKGPTHARVVVLDESSGRLDLDNSDEPEDSEVHAGKVLFATERGKASDIGSSSQIKPKSTIHDQDSFVHSQPKHQKQQLLTPSNTSSCQDTHIHASLSEGGRRLERPELHRVDREGASKDFHTDEDSVDHTSTDNDRVVGPTAGSGDSDADLDTRNAAKSKKPDSELRRSKSKDLDVDIDTVHEVYDKPSTGLRVSQKSSLDESATKADIDNESKKQVDTESNEYPKSRRATNGAVDRQQKSKKEGDELRTQPADNLEIELESQNEVYPKTKSDHKPETIAGLRMTTKLEEEEYPQMVHTNDLEIHMSAQRETYPKPAKATIITDRTVFEEAAKSEGCDSENGLDLRTSKALREEESPKPTDDLEVQIDSEREVYPTRITQKTKLEEEVYLPESSKPKDDLDIQMESEREVYPTRITPKTSYEESTKSLDKEPERGVGIRTKLEEEDYPQKSVKPTDDLEIQLDSEKEVYPTRITPKTTYEESTKSADEEPKRGVGLRMSTKLEEEEYPKKSSKPKDDLEIQLDSEKEVYPTRITPKTTYEESRKSTDDKPENGYRASTKLEEEEYPQKSDKPEDDRGIQLDSEKEVYPSRITPKTTYDESAKSADKEPERGVGLRTSTKLEEEEYPKKSSQPTDDLEIQLDSEKDVYPTRIAPKTTYEESTKSTDDKPENGFRASTKLEEEEYPQKSAKPKDDLEIQLDSEKEVYPSRITPKTTYEESTKSTDDKPENGMGIRASTELEEEEYPQKSSKPKDDLEIELDSQREVYPTRITQRSTYEESTKSAEEEPKRGVGLRMSTKLEDEEYPQMSSKPIDVSAQIETDREEFPPSAAGVRISQKTSYEESTAHKDVPDVLKPDHDLEIQRSSEKEEAKTKTTPQPSVKPGIKQKSDYAESSRGTPDHEQQKEDSVEDEPDVSSMKGRILHDEPSKKAQTESNIQTTVSPKPHELAKGKTAVTTDLETEDKFEDAEESQGPSSPSLSGKRFTPLGRESITDAATFKAITPDADKSSSTVSTPSVLDETELHDEDLSPYVSADEEQTTSDHHVQHIPTTPSDHVTSLPSSESVLSHQTSSAITPSTSQSEDGEASVTFKGKREPLSGKGQRQTDIGVSIEQQREPSLIQIRAKGKIETQELRTDMPTVGSLEGQEISFQIKGDGGKMEIVGLPQLAAGKAGSSEVISIALPSSDEESTSFLEPKSVREKRLQPGRATEADSRDKPSYYDSGESSEELESSTDVQALFKEPMQRRTSGELIFDSRERMMQKAETVLSSLAEKGLQQVAKIRSERAKERRIDDTDGHKLVSPVQSSITETDEREKELTDRFAAREASSIIDDVLRSEEMSRLLGLKAGKRYGSEEVLHRGYSLEDSDEASSGEEIHSHLYHAQGIEDLAHAASELELDTGKGTQKSFARSDKSDSKDRARRNISDEFRSPRVMETDSKSRKPSAPMAGEVRKVRKPDVELEYFSSDDIKKGRLAFAKMFQEKKPEGRDSDDSSNKLRPTSQELKSSESVGEEKEVVTRPKTKDSTKSRQKTRITDYSSDELEEELNETQLEEEEVRTTSKLSQLTDETKQRDTSPWVRRYSSEESDDGTDIGHQRFKDRDSVQPKSITNQLKLSTKEQSLRKQDPSLRKGEDKVQVVEEGRLDLPESKRSDTGILAPVGSEGIHVQQKVKRQAALLVERPSEGEKKAKISDQLAENVARSDSPDDTERRLESRNTPLRSGMEKSVQLTKPGKVGVADSKTVDSKPQLADSKVQRVVPSTDVDDERDVNGLSHKDMSPTSPSRTVDQCFTVTDTTSLASPVSSSPQMDENHHHISLQPPQAIPSTQISRTFPQASPSQTTGVERPKEPLLTDNVAPLHEPDVATAARRDLHDDDDVDITMHEDEARVGGDHGVRMTTARDKPYQREMALPHTAEVLAVPHQHEGTRSLVCGDFQQPHGPTEEVSQPRDLSMLSREGLPVTKIGVESRSVFATGGSTVAEVEGATPPGITIKSDGLVKTSTSVTIQPQVVEQDGSGTVFLQLDDEVARAMREEAKPAEVNVAVGQRVELKADIPGNPRIRWLHNGMEVSDTKFSKYLTTGDLHVLALSKVGPEHAGVFTCEATTPEGIVTCDIIIKVEEPKEPPETPKTQVKEGHRVELKAEIPDSRRIEWLLDGKLIRETEDRRYTSFGDMHSLTIISVKPEDAGTYTCVAMTPRGEVTCNIKLEVEKTSNQEVIKMVEMDQSLQAQELKLPEEPCTQPTTLDVLEGQEVTLRAEVPDDADVTWLFNDKEISNTESIAVSATNHTSTLTIRKVQREFEGTYTCIATTPHGTGRCQIILHIIPSSPPNVTSSMRKQTVRTQELTFRVPMLLMERSTAPGTIDIQEGQELNIRAEIPGKPDITWLFNGKELKASDEVQFGVDKDVYMLTVTKVTRHWSGTFTCIAKTPSGKTVCDIVVNVKEATDQHLEMEKTLETEGAEVQMQQWRLRSPVQTTQPTPAVAQFEVKEGQEVTLRAEIPGQADIMWMFEGKELSESDNISFSSDGDVHILKINNVTSDFSGKFTCVAKTDHGAATCDILLTVGPPTLTQKTTELLQIQRPAAQTPPQFFEVKEGQEVNLRAEVPGSKSVKWSFNGKELSKSDQLTFFSEYDIHTLRITKVTKEWAGTFTCSAATETGETTCDIVLSIKDSDLALRGDRTESRIAKEMQVTSQVVRKDTGASTEVTVKEGQEVTLQAGIPGNYIIKWLHGGKLLPDSAAFKQMTKGDLHILTIPKIKREHAGTYTCQATSGTTTVKCDIIVHVTEQERLVPPDFKIKPRSQRVEKGGTVSLISEVSGEPKPSVSWLKDGKEVLETSRITTRHVGKNYILEISDAGEEDSGSYTCVGTNAAGQYSCTATLHVYDELIGGYHIAGNGSALATTNVGTVTSTHVEVPEGQQVSLQATLPGDDVKWMYNGEELNPSTQYKQSTRGTTHTLTINRVSKQQEGTYTCEATGPTGVSKCDLVITVLPKKKEMVPPDFVSQPKPATVDDGESVEFCCQITGDPQPEVHWLKNGQEVKTPT